MKTADKIKKQKLKILVPTDFSGHGLNAGAFAIELLKNAPSEIILENVFQVPKENTGTLISISDIIKTESQERLNKECAELKSKSKKILITTKSEEGQPVNTVKQALKKSNADLLVIGHNTKIDKFSASFIGQPECWPTLLVPGMSFTKIPNEAIIISTTANNDINLPNALTEISKKFKDKLHHIYFTKNSTVEHLKTSTDALLKQGNIGMIIFYTCKGDWLEQAIKEHQLDSMFFSHPSLLISNNGR
jgi:nucleotide-binding universal stress UspA family protein